jgi:hypothetical protein
MVKLRVEINEKKRKIVDLANGGRFTFLGFEYRRILGRNRKWRACYAPKIKKRTALLAKLKEIFRKNISQPVERVIELDLLATALSSPVPDAGRRLIDRRLALAAVSGRPLQNFQEIVHGFPIAKHFPDRFPPTRCEPAFRK